MSNKAQSKVNNIYDIIHFMKVTKNTLFTGKGDSGTTTLFQCNQKRISKSASIIEALGATDELNAYLGVVKVYPGISKLNIFIGKKKISFKNILGDMQQTLFIIQAEIAGTKMKPSRDHVDSVEKIINAIALELPPVKSFTVSGGNIISAQLDYLRTLARRCERRVVAVLDDGERDIDFNTISYLNRLSSVLFALSRYVNHVMKVKEDHPLYETTVKN